MQPEPAESWWQRWGRILLLGVILGVLQILALVAAQPLALVFLSLWPPVIASVFFYLLISAIAGFMAADRRGTVSSGIIDACLVGGVSFLIIAILAADPSVTAFSAPQPACSSDCSYSRFPMNPQYLTQVFAIFLLFFEGIGALVGGIVGGWIGAILAQRQAHF